MEYQFKKFERFDLPITDDVKEVSTYLKEQLNVMVDDLNTGLGQDDPSVSVYNEKAQGTAGDAATSNTWNVRTLDRSSGSFTVESNVILLPKGIYEVKGWALATGAVVSHQLRLYNVTDDSTLVLGGSMESGASSLISGEFTVNNDIRVEVQHFAQAGGAFGVAITGSNKIEKELYAQLDITKKG